MAAPTQPRPKRRRNARPGSGCTEAATIRMTPAEMALTHSLADGESLSMNTLVRKAILAYAERTLDHPQATATEIEQIPA